MSHMSLPELPVELLHRIFNYVDTQTLLHSIRPVCRQLNAKVQTYNKLRLDFPTPLRASNIIAMTDSLQPENVISLALMASKETEIPELHRFTRLQSLTLTEINDMLSNQFFEHMITCPLTTLSLTTCAQTVAETRQIITLLSSSIGESTIQNLNLDISKIEMTCREARRPFQSVLRRLTIYNCHYSEYHQILSSSPFLQTLVIEECILKGIETQTMPLLGTANYSHLTSLTLYGCFFPVEKLYLLLSFTSSLVQLDITSSRSELGGIFNGFAWEKFIRTKLPCLKTFQFLFAYSPHESLNYLSLPSIIERYRTPFWLNDKHWTVNCDYVLTSNVIKLYTKPNPIDDFEIVINSEPLSVNSCNSFFSKQRYDHHRYIYTKEVSDHLTQENNHLEK
jgi:hypothetical protein